jgi:hypothetical protein
MSLLGLLAACGGARIERDPIAANPVVQVTLGHTASDVAARVRSGYSAEPSLTGFLVSGRQDQTFPDDFQLRAHATDNPPLEQYVRLPPAQREHDLYLWDPLSRYWTSEYRVGNKPAEFSTRYILHFADAAPHSASVEVIEDLPVVRAGRKFQFGGHGGPGFYDDIRPVAPTVSDRMRMLQMIERLAQ